MDRTTVVEVTGMTCANCVKHVTEELEGVHGVLDVSVELRVGEVSPVTLVSNDSLDEAALRAAVDEAGYEVATIHG